MKTFFFLPLDSLETLVKTTVDHRLWVYFWTLNSISLVSMSVFIPVLHCFDYLCFVVSFKMEKCDSSYIVPLFQDCFGYSNHLVIHMNFRISLSTSTKKSTWILKGVIGHFGEICYFNNMKSLDPCDLKTPWGVFSFI